MSKRALTFDNVLSMLDQHEVMQKYFGRPVILGKRYLNPFREDDTPGCTFKMINNILTLVDYASPFYGDCISVCSFRLGIGIYPALIHLNKEYNLGLGYTEPTLADTSLRQFDLVRNFSEKQYSKITYERYEDFLDNDYFFDYHITRDTLNLFNVFACHKVWVENNGSTEIFRWSDKQPLYIYEKDLALKKRKMYRPLSPKNKKWRSNNDLLEGFTGDTDELVVRTSSLKDSMVLHECGVLADNPSCENVIAKKRNNMILLYDNDTPGKALSAKHSEYYDCPYILMPEVTYQDKKLKDPSDFAKAFGLDYLKDILEDAGIRTNRTRTTSNSHV
ncbi:MAG TPA: hypothetical protein PKD00_03955 [Burkholderiales bacterium]|nr:hypothetical protein [Burkholderiales bacterium]